MKILSIFIINNMDNIKICITCSKILPLADFYLNDKIRMIYRNKCKKCYNKSVIRKKNLYNVILQHNTTVLQPLYIMSLIYTHPNFNIHGQPIDNYNLIKFILQQYNIDTDPAYYLPDNLPNIISGLYLANLSIFEKIE